MLRFICFWLLFQIKLSSSEDCNSIHVIKSANYYVNRYNERSQEDVIFKLSSVIRNDCETVGNLVAVQIDLTLARTNCFKSISPNGECTVSNDPLTECHGAQVMLTLSKDKKRVKRINSYMPGTCSTRSTDEPNQCDPVSATKAAKFAIQEYNVANGKIHKLERMITFKCIENSYVLTFLMTRTDCNQSNGCRHEDDDNQIQCTNVYAVLNSQRNQLEEINLGSCLH